MGKTVNQTELAEIVGVSDVTIWEWQKEGLPILHRGERGEANHYDTANVIEWLKQRALQLAGKAETQRDRETRFRADLLEIELAEKRKILVPVTEIEPIWTSRVMTAAAYQMSRASRLAGILEATPGIEAKRAVLKKEDAEFLTRLGTDGARMQQELTVLLEKSSVEETAALMRRLAGYDQQPAVESAQGGVGSVDPA